MVLNFHLSSSETTKHYFIARTNSQFDWLIRGPSKDVLDLEKAYWTSDSATIQSRHVLTDKHVRSVGREIYRVLIQIGITDGLPKIYRELTENFECSYVILLVSHKNGLRMKFHNFPKIFHNFSKTFNRLILAEAETTLH